MFLKKTHVSPPLCVPPCALLKEGKERDMTVLNINKGYHPMKFEGSGSKGTQVI